MQNGHEEARVLLTVGQLSEPLTGRHWDSAGRDARGLGPGRPLSARWPPPRRPGAPAFRQPARVLRRAPGDLAARAPSRCRWTPTLTRVELERLAETVAPRFSVVDDAHRRRDRPRAAARGDGRRRDRVAPARRSAAATGGRGAPGVRRARALHLRIERRAQGRGAHPRLAGRPVERAAARARPRGLRPHALPPADPLRARAHLQQPLPLARRPGPLHHAALPARSAAPARRDHRRAPHHLPLVGARDVAPRAPGGPPAARRHAPASALRLRAPARHPVGERPRLGGHAGGLQHLRPHRDRELGGRHLGRPVHAGRRAHRAAVGRGPARAARRRGRRARRARSGRCGSRAPRSCAATSGRTT